MLARCARCQGTFSTDRFGRQVCPHCGSELWLAEPAGAPPAEPAPPGEAPAPAGGEPTSPPSPAPPGAPEPPPAGPAWGAPPAPPEWTGAGPQPLPPPGPGGAIPPPAGGGWGGASQPARPRGPLPGETELGAPFTERSRRGFLGTFFETWKLVAVEPARFFRRVRVDQTGSAVLFGLIAYTFGTVVQSLFGWLSGQQGLVMIEQFASRMPPGQAELLRSYTQHAGGGFLLAEVLTAPLLGVVAIYLAAGMTHLLLMLFRGAGRGFDATLTTVGYAFGVYALLAVPGCGGLVAPIWFVVVLVLGLGESQRCGTGKAAAAVLGPALLVCVCCCAAILGLGSLSGLGELFKGGIPRGTTTTL